MKRLCKLLILVAYLPVTHASNSTAWPLDDFITPAYDCLDQVANEVGFADDSLLSRCRGVESTISSLWALARYYRVSKEIKNPSPLVEMAHQKLFHYLNRHSANYLISVLVHDSSHVNSATLAWLLRLEMEVSQIKTSPAEHVRPQLHELTMTAAAILHQHLSPPRLPDNSRSLNNWAWLLWQYHSWTKFTMVDSGKKWAEGSILNYYENSTSCQSAQNLEEIFSVSRCFLEILAVKSVLSTDAFKIWLRIRIPDPRIYASDTFDPSEPGAIKNLGLAPSRLLVIREIRDQIDSADGGWFEAYNFQLKTTLENLPLWRDKLDQAIWLGPLSLMALTSDYNKVESFK